MKISARRIDHLSLRTDEQRGQEHYSLEEHYSCEMVPKDIASYSDMSFVNVLALRLNEEFMKVNSEDGFVEISAPTWPCCKSK